MKPFGGEHVPRGIIICLKKMVAALTLHRFRDGDVIYSTAISRAYAAQNETDSSKKYWYLVKLPSGVINGYVNIYPGEFSAVRPSGDVIILEPEIDFSITLSGAVQQLLQNIQGAYQHLTDEERRLFEIIEQILNWKGDKNSFFLNQYKTMSDAVLTCSDLKERKKKYEQLRRYFFDNYHLPLVDHAICDVLLKIQSLLGIICTGNIYADPIRGLYDLIATCKDWPGAAEKLVELDKEYYDIGNDFSTQFLNSADFEQSIDLLRDAAFVYYSSTILGKAILSKGLSNKLGRSSDMAEEGWASSMSGIMSFDFVVNTIKSHILELAEENKIRGQAFHSYFINKRSSKICPYLPRRTAKILIAAAKIECNENVLAQIDNLEKLDQTSDVFQIAGNFDLWLQDMQLADGYLKVNDLGKREAYIIRAATRYMFR